MLLITYMCSEGLQDWCQKWFSALQVFSDVRALWGKSFAVGADIPCREENNSGLALNVLMP